MKITIITMLLICLPGTQQESMEKQAIEAVQRIPVSSLDSALPGYSFATWFNTVIGPGAGVVWQLTECGERADQQNGGDLNACLEAIAILADGRKVAVAISVGTFKKGLSGFPVFQSAVIDQNDQLYVIRRLRDLPQRLLEPRIVPISLPEVTVTLRQSNRYMEPGFLTPVKIELNPYPAMPLLPLAPASPPPNQARPEAAPAESTSPQASPEPPATPEPQRPQKVGEGLLRGRALIKAMPTFPPAARSLDLFFRTVVIAVLVSEQGRVVSAKVMRGHPILQEPALEAARKWVFEPATFNGRPIKVESILTFVFNPDR